MKILLFGANGQLGNELARQLPMAGNLVAFTHDSLDITDHLAVVEAVSTLMPDVIVNAAAYTAVDKAEGNQELAYSINAYAVENLAKVSRDAGAWLVHYSTDYVFDGRKAGPYLESDTPNPINFYGFTKNVGDQAVEKYAHNYLIFVTSWVIGKDGSNFVKSILNHAEEKKEISIVEDQIGAPTSCGLVSRVTVEAINAMKKNEKPVSGKYNLVPSGETNWFEMAQTLQNLSRSIGTQLFLNDVKFKPISAIDYPMAAKRPKNSRLNTDKLRSTFSIEFPSWEKDFSQVSTEILKGIYSS